MTEGQITMERIALPILVTGMRRFYSLTEKLQPEETLAFLNSYLDAVIRAVESVGGGLMDTEGDRVISSHLGPPESVLAAAGAKQAVMAINRRRIAMGLKRIAIGQAAVYGDVIRGVIGSKSERRTSFIGNALSAAFRLEDLTREYRAGLLITGEIRLGLPPDSEVRFLDRIRLDGFQAPVEIYEIFDYEPEKVRDKKRAIQPLLDKAFELYKNGYFKDARNVYREIRDKAGMHIYDVNSSLDPVLDFYIARCDELLARFRLDQSGGAVWNGVYDFRVKKE